MKAKRSDLNNLFATLDMPMAAKWSESRMQDKIAKLNTVVDEDTEAGEYTELLEGLIEATAEGTTIEIVDDAGKTKSKGKAVSAPKKGKAKAKVVEEADDEDDDDEDEEEPAPKKTKGKAKGKTKTKVVEDDDEDDDEEEPAPKKTKGKAKAKPTADDDDDDDDDDDEPAPKKTKGKGAKKPKADKGPKKPGVIATIAKCLKKATAKKPTTKDAILEVLREEFPERDPESMMRTINVQVPNRISREQGIPVEKNDKGYYSPAE